MHIMLAITMEAQREEAFTIYMSFSCRVIAGTLKTQGAAFATSFLPEQLTKEDSVYSASLCSAIPAPRLGSGCYLGAIQPPSLGPIACCPGPSRFPLDVSGQPQVRAAHIRRYKGGFDVAASSVSRACRAAEARQFSSRPRYWQLISTRRLSERPASVRLSAIGAASPMPRAERRDSAMPRAASAATTAAARRWDRSWL